MAVTAELGVTAVNDFFIPEIKGNGHSEAEKGIIIELLDSISLTSHFQAVFSTDSGTVYGYEALARITGDNEKIGIGELFKMAIHTNTISSLDMRCRENAIKLASSLGIKENGGYLFLNICPETLIDPAHKVGGTDEVAERWGMPKEKIILEITEESAIHNYSLFKQAVAYYRDGGYKIAIDDFGAGYGGLKMLSLIEPDFIKIDRHFISDIDKMMVNFNLVDSIVTACHRLGIKVIAEGIERGEELKVCLNMGIELLQGYYLHKPSPSLNGDRILIDFDKKLDRSTGDSEQQFIGNISNKVEPIHPSVDIMTAFKRFIKDAELRGLPVVDVDRIVGILHRSRFLENQILGKYGFGMQLNNHKKIAQLMEQPSLMVETNTTIEDVAQRIQLRKFEFLYDDVCVTKNGKYHGTVAIHILLDAITERNLILARDANPLTGLPGNDAIHRTINKMLSQNMHFDVCYIDLNNFKPYNDCYGFEKGDCVLKTLGGILEDVIKSDGSSIGFVGHIGGDDFILITRPQISISMCQKIISDFESHLPEFHGMEDYKKGFYISRNRKEEEEKFNFLSISIGIASTEIYKIESYAHLASIAAEVKKAAKMQKGSSIVKDKRMPE
jgi:diguanylate cyclase (GGDEF)-like protein